MQLAVAVIGLFQSFILDNAIESIALNLGHTCLKENSSNNLISTVLFKLKTQQKDF